MGQETPSRWAKSQGAKACDRFNTEADFSKKESSPEGGVRRASCSAGRESPAEGLAGCYSTAVLRGAAMVR